MARLIAFLCASLVFSTPALAGAWLREKGASFTSLALTAFCEPGKDIRFKSSLYGEWGMRPNLTLGLDAEEHQDLYGHAVVFARLPVAEFSNGGRLAAELGVGAHHRGTRAWAMYKATLSWGKGFQARYGSGWMAADAALEYRSHDALIRKLDLTVGLSSHRRVNPLLQIETSYVPGRPLYWSARPSAMFRSESGPNTWIIGVERNAAQDRPGLRFALWREF
ncbi:hypothetical protein [Ruegeria arenilitoris]|uniref:hypothetical protein n=1 Tax=Ruegeria arenilitoris TaxID=1173585 RepID=UPI00147D5FC2|nr:hypothetical protein [Ruegeria arenilitoris]